jgi:hypothetical protein
VALAVVALMVAALVVQVIHHPLLRHKAILVALDLNLAVTVVVAAVVALVLLAQTEQAAVLVTAVLELRLQSVVLP